MPKGGGGGSGPARPTHKPEAADPAGAVPEPQPNGDAKRETARPAKRPRDASSSSSSSKPLHGKPVHGNDSGIFRKEDPSRAAALPRTVALDSTEAATFSAATFAELPLERYLRGQICDRMGLSTLTRVQQETIPLLLQGSDAMVRSPTGSGKTLAYAVPLVQRLVALGSSVVTRAAGTFALVLVPTRELAVQTHEAIETLSRPFPWLVTSILMGGERKKAEKARLRKGVAVVVATPGRVSDHLDSTASFNLASCRLLVLDEADRLLDMGFHKTIGTIIGALEQRAADALWPAWSDPRQTVMLSATLTPSLRELAGSALRDPATVRLDAAAALPRAAPPPAKKAAAATDPEDTHADEGDATAAAAAGGGGGAAADLQLEAPSQLQQNYAVLPPKQRLTALLGFLRSRAKPDETAAGSAAAAACKIVVFFSSCDGVDFHHELLAKGSWPGLREAAVAAGHAPALESDGRANGDDDGDDDNDDGEDEARGGGGGAGALGDGGPVVQSELLGASLIKLHGKMDKQERSQAFDHFRKTKKGGILLCTDVAARGLNLQGVHWIVQYDLPPDPKEYVHRVGRAARLGQRGQALIMLHPSEAPFLQLLQQGGMVLRELTFASLQAALCPGGSRRDMYVLELALQRQLEERIKHVPYLHAAAASAFQGYVRAYAAHTKAVSRLLHIGQLHLGHLAKSFGLRETPTAVAKQQHKRQKATGGAGKQKKRKGIALAERLKKSQRVAGGQAGIGGSVSVSEFAA